MYASARYWPHRGVMGLFLVSDFPSTDYKLFKERNYLFYDDGPQ